MYMDDEGCLNSNEWANRNSATRGNKYYEQPFNVSYVVLNYINFYSCTEKSSVITLKLYQSIGKHVFLLELFSNKFFSQN